MNDAHRTVDLEYEAKREKERKLSKANKLKLEIEELFDESE
jgi:hypothetical protein|tara:strand:- start:1 stop:123 length:123 start_codon:yes stop_codon:yes gene_type:complete